MDAYKKLNILIGWGIFLIAATTYMLTLEPTVSFWDCGEFISASFKLQVGHAPGAPLFLLVGRLFTLFAGDNPEKVALTVNALSGLVSAFTILFLFWTITHLVKRFLVKADEPSLTEKLIIFGSGALGALAYTFSETFWFSAVEGEVYATSSLFTAIVFWAILKWENEADEKYANRWLVLIAYLMGLSIGVHLLNLLAIPAIVLIYYFKKYKPASKGVALALLMASGILGAIMYIIIPGLVKIAGWFELLFVNGFGLPYFSGVFVYLILLIGGVVYGIYYTQKQGKVLANTVLLVFGVIIIGYSSYATIVIRSLANPPMDINNPENMFTLLSYLNREQYGEQPLIYGQAFNAPLVELENGEVKYKDDKPIYVQEDGKYKRIGHTQLPVFDRKFKMLFPRMHSRAHEDQYLKWADIDYDDLYEPVRGRNGEIVFDQNGDVTYKPKKKPGVKSNLVFLFRYQLGHMYYRYFMWNFAGRQNDILSQNRNEINAGNWLTGIKAVDAERLGNQSELTSEMLANRARNTYFLLPLLLGLIGMIFHYRKDRKSFWVVMSLFFFTGIAVVLYLNQTPDQPRERDYAYAGSFYAFAIWIGMAVAGFYHAAREFTWKNYSRTGIWGSGVVAFLVLYDYLVNDRVSYSWTYILLLFMIFVVLALIKGAGIWIRENKYLAAGIILVCMLVPVLMAVQNWDDHDRSGRYTARDAGYNYLNSCGDNAILYTMGDNETYPVWYMQDVEEERTDIRVVNLSFLNEDWYINQMRRKAYDADPVKMGFEPHQIYRGIRDRILLEQYDPNGFLDLAWAMDVIRDDKSQPKAFPNRKGDSVDYYYLPGCQFTMPVNLKNLSSNGTIYGTEGYDQANPFYWAMQPWQTIYKSQLMMLDFMVQNNWERPICYASTMGDPFRNEDIYLGLYKYLESRGMAYTLNPLSSSMFNKDTLYGNLMNKFKYGGIEKDIYINEDCNRTYRSYQNLFAKLALEYLQSGNNLPVSEHAKERAAKLADRAVFLFSDDQIPLDHSSLDLLRVYAKLGDSQKVRGLGNEIWEILSERINYINSLDKPFVAYLDQNYVYETVDILWGLYKVYLDQGFTDSSEKAYSALHHFIERHYHMKNTALARTWIRSAVRNYNTNVAMYFFRRDNYYLTEALKDRSEITKLIGFSRQYEKTEYLLEMKLRILESEWGLAKEYYLTGKTEEADEIKDRTIKFIDESYESNNSAIARQAIRLIKKDYEEGISAYGHNRNLNFQEILISRNMLDQLIRISRTWRDIPFVDMLRTEVILPDINLAVKYDTSGSMAEAEKIRDNISGEIDRLLSMNSNEQALREILGIYQDLWIRVQFWRERPDTQTMEAIQSVIKMADRYMLHNISGRFKSLNSDQQIQLLYYAWELIKYNFMTGETQLAQNHEQSFLHLMEYAYANSQENIWLSILSMIYNDFNYRLDLLRETSSPQIEYEWYLGYTMLNKMVSLLKEAGEKRYIPGLEQGLRQYETLITSIGTQ